MINFQFSTFCLPLKAFGTIINTLSTIKSKIRATLDALVVLLRALNPYRYQGSVVKSSFP